jgi:hypothetical protein
MFILSLQTNVSIYQSYLASTQQVKAFLTFMCSKANNIRAHIAKCEVGVRMGMQKNAWMTGHLFEKWLSHFVDYLQRRGGVSPSNRHLLILDGHDSHVTIEVIEKAWTVGIDMITLPSHTSHALQPLDVSCFKSFKQAFRICRDMWTMNNRGQGAKKDTLTEWVFLGLKKALIPSNIRSGFKATGIYPLNAHACDKHFSPSQGFISSTSNEEGTNSDCSSDEEDNFDDLQPETEDQCTQSQEAGGEDIDDGIESEDDFEL